MGIIFTILRSRVGQIVLALLAGVLVYNLWIHVLHKKWTAEEKGKAAVQVLEKTKEVQEDAKKRKEKVERMAPDDLLKYWGGGRVQPDGPAGGAPASPR